MEDRFFAAPILNSPYACPARHWELDEDGQPTQKIVERRRWAFAAPAEVHRIETDLAAAVERELNRRMDFDAARPVA